MPDNPQLSDADFLNLLKNPDQLDSFLDGVAGRIDQARKTLAKEAPYTPLIPTPQPKPVDLTMLAPMVVAKDGVPVEKDPEPPVQNTSVSDGVPKPEPRPAEPKRVDVVPPAPIKTQAPSMVSQTVPEKAEVQTLDGVPEGSVDEAPVVVSDTPESEKLPEKPDIKLKEVDDAASLKAREKKIQDMLNNDKGQTI
ncbi:MAG: hypothetical protein AB7F28_05685 [Candidatus Margulisiibacteriota bacterium]